MTIVVPSAKSRATAASSTWSPIAAPTPPGRVKREIVLPFGAERSQELRRQPEFLDLREEIQQLLFAEVTEV